MQNGGRRAMQAGAFSKPAFDDRAYAGALTRNSFVALMLRHPSDVFGIAAALCGVTAILINALFLQTARHPAPLFGANVVNLRANEAIVPPVKSPQPRPTELTRIDAPRAVKATAPNAAVNAPANAAASANADPLGDLISANRRVMAVQRALTQFGYGQIKPDGAIGPETRAAIERFEKEQKMPVTGKISDKLVRDLGALTGRPLE